MQHTTKRRKKGSFLRYTAFAAFVPHLYLFIPSDVDEGSVLPCYVEEVGFVENLYKKYSLLAFNWWIRIFSLVLPQQRQYCDKSILEFIIHLTPHDLLFTWTVVSTSSLPSNIFNLLEKLTFQGYIVLGRLEYSISLFFLAFVWPILYTRFTWLVSRRLGGLNSQVLVKFLIRQRPPVCFVTTRG